MGNEVTKGGICPGMIENVNMARDGKLKRGNMAYGMIEIECVNLVHRDGKFRSGKVAARSV
jgi:hypothetical protein